MVKPQISAVWHLYGTLGCHLCEQAEQQLQQLADARAIRLQVVDIAELSTLYMNQWATQIPVLITPHVRLNWPFSLLDLMQAYQEDIADD